MAGQVQAFGKPLPRAVRSAAPVRPGLLQRCGGRQCPEGTCDHRTSRVPAAVREAMRSPGQPLPSPTRDVMEAEFGHDFSQVRVHADSQAAEAAGAVDANAFTLGNHIVFGTSRWAPQTPSGSRLLAHELAHVLQQPSGPYLDGEGLNISHSHDPAEREAEAVAAGFGGPMPPQAGPIRDPRIARQESGQADRPTAPILNPADPRVNKILERIAAGSAGNVDPACQAPLAESPPWMPNLRRRSPVELGQGTRRQPKLKEPDGPAGAKCRGACGADCPDTCKFVGTYSEQYEAGNCGYLIEFPNALLCGTHAGCRDHDSCFDAAVANGETELGGDRHRACNSDALLKYGPKNTKSWAQGGGPYDAWWYFADNPVVRQSWRLREPADAGSGSRPSR